MLLLSSWVARAAAIQGCTELMGIGPIELLRAQQDAFTRRCWPAITSRPHQALVGDIAQRFGFRSRGHFAAAYQEQYGQSPSQTLNSGLKNGVMLHVIGTTAAGLSGLASAQRQLVDGAAVVAAPALHHELPAGAQLISTDQPQAAIEVALEAAGRSAVLLAGGDPLWFGIGRLLLQRFSAEQLRFHPALFDAAGLLPFGAAVAKRAMALAAWPRARCLGGACCSSGRRLAVLTDPGRGGAGEVRQILRPRG